MFWKKNKHRKSYLWDSRVYQFMRGKIQYTIRFLYNAKICSTGKSFSEALILASTNPQYDKRLPIELQVQYMKITSSECFVHKLFSVLTFMNNLLSNCGLVDARISASEKDLPVVIEDDLV